MPLRFEQFNEGAKKERGPEFDREAEKEKRKKIRKLLEKSISAPLKESGFKKSGQSYWLRKAGDRLQLVYLQRSQVSHQYFIEAGVCLSGDVPEGKKPDIVYCKIRERIEKVISDTDKVRGSKEQGDATKEKVKRIYSALQFEVPGGLEKYPNEYYFPSVSIEEAQQKIEEIAGAVKEYIPKWLDDQSGDEIGKK